MSAEYPCPHCGDEGWTTTLDVIIRDAHAEMANHGYDGDEVCCPDSMHGAATWAGKVLILAAMIMDLKRQLAGLPTMAETTETEGMN